ncbi:MAG: isochorismatase family cysteine hydrolase [Ginsengibacter sp.]
MQALIIVDAQNEFSPSGKRPVEDFAQAVQVIDLRLKEAREKGNPIAWVRHFNKPAETPAFIPGSWGADFIPEFGPELGAENEKEFVKEVYGAFTGSNIGEWLDYLEVTEVLIVGFYTHGCVSTTTREAIMKGYSVLLDADATSSFSIKCEGLGELSASEVKRSALLHLVSMGAQLYSDKEPIYS